MDQFVHLHVHDEYSMLDGASDTSLLVEATARLGQPALAQTNHGNLFGSYRFHKECKTRGIKPIIGMEAYVAPSSRQVRRKVHWGTPEQSREDISGSGSYTHLTLLAKDSAGVRQLFDLSSRSFTEGFYFKPRIDLEMLEEVSRRDGGGHLIIGSGCLSGELLTRIALGQEEQARDYVARMVDTYGQDFFIEVMDHHFDRETRHLQQLLELADRHGVAVVATNDSHYTKASDHLLHDAMLCLGTNAKLSDEKRMRFDGAGYWLKSRGEMDLLDLPQEALDRTLWIAEQVLPYDEVFAHELRMPASGIADPETTLRSWVEGCLDNLGSTVDQTAYTERAEYELGVIIPAGYADYMLILEDICRFARGADIPIWFRGSAAASLVAYLLRVVDVDPLPHGLLFERFLNPERVSLPDVDLDVSADRRDEVLDYITGKYGAEFCARINSNARIKSKAALASAARILGRPFGTGSVLARALPRSEFGREPTLSEADMSLVDDQEVWDMAVGLEGLTSRPGLHAAGFVISPVPLTSVLPTYIPERKGGTPATQWDMDAVADLGLVKFDLLGSKILDVIHDALTMSGARLPTRFDDPEVFKLLSAGNTLGCFQLDGGPMRSLLRRLAPRTFEDLAAVLALYRPGPMGVGAHTAYADRLNGRENVRYPHRELAGPLRDILAPTYGVIVYQEQVMQALQRVCGYSLAQADLVRKAMGKKDRALLAAEYSRFRDGGLSNDFSEQALKALWEVLVPFADYAFNKSHATAYAYNSYWCAWLKVHHPWEFMSSLLSHASTAVKDGKPSQAEEYISEVRRMGIPVLPPSINGGGTWTPGTQGIHYGMLSIKGVGDKVLPGLLKGAPYRSWEDFLHRAPTGALNKGTVSALVRGGALDGLGSREGILSVAEQHIDASLKERKEKTGGDRGFRSRTLSIPEMPPDWPNRRADELAALGVELSHPPVQIYVGPNGLDEDGWIYLNRCIHQARGASTASIRFGTWKMRISSMVDGERLQALVAPIGVKVQ